jgi:murein DD-endopeptidase MepM/ murein hydrolase activator NlpD
VSRGAPPLWFRAAARIRGVATFAGVLAIAAGLAGGLFLPEDWFPGALNAALSLGGFVLLLVGLALTLVPGAPAIRPRQVAPPVTGRWSALNSPASRRPSHGTHGYGQTFAVDLVYEPENDARPAFGSGPAFRPPEDYPGFGQEVLAPVDGRVHAVRNGARDHRTRSTWPAVVYMLVAGMFRELGGPGQLLGNYVTVDLGDGAYAVLAHLQRGSIAVEPGQQVARGDVLARCGNSGNSSEPHVHFQLMDHPRPFVAAGLPFVFTGIRIDGSEPRDGVPANEQVMVADDLDLRARTF